LDVIVGDPATAEAWHNEQQRHDRPESTGAGGGPRDEPLAWPEARRESRHAASRGAHESSIEHMLLLPRMAFSCASSLHTLRALTRIACTLVVCIYSARPAS